MTLTTLCLATLSLAPLFSPMAVARDQPTIVIHHVVAWSAVTPSVAVSRGAQGTVLAQGGVQIPTDAQLERMEERAITTRPLDARAPRLRGGERPRSARWMSEPIGSTRSSWGGA